MSQFHQWTGPLTPDMETPAAWSVTASIWIVLIGLLLYARIQARKGVLR